LSGKVLINKGKIKMKTKIIDKLTENIKEQFELCMKLKKYGKLSKEDNNRLIDLSHETHNTIMNIT
jgi:hypothetical protein